MRKDTPLSSSTKLRKRPGLTGLPSERSFHRPSPFLKWAGGKGQLLATYDQFFPASFNNYCEPFTGGGAVFFHLKNTRAAFSATLSDLNDELVNCYRVIRDEPDELIARLMKHENSSEYFYWLRSLDASTLSNAARAARLIYLNKTCFNGLYRVNSKGQFNVPFGSYKNPNFCDRTNLIACSAALKNVDVAHRNFEEVLEHARKGDFVYFDPPYHPLSTTANFTSYTKNSFSPADQEKLAKVALKLSKRGCKVMLSNSDTPFIRSIYSQFTINTVYALRAINCKAEGRGPVAEVVATNY